MTRRFPTACFLPGYLTLLACWACGAPPSEEAAREGVDPAWDELFNGRDLSGWTPKIRGEALGEDAAGQPHLAGKAFDGPGALGKAVYELEGFADMPVAKGVDHRLQLWVLADAGP